MTRLEAGVPHALVTGATEGIGRSFVHHLSREGFDLTLVARSPDALDRVAGQVSDTTGRQVDVLAADLADERGCAAVEARIAAGPPIHVLVNNAGIGLAGAFLTNGVEAEDRLLRVNVRAVLRLTHAALPSMISRQGGAIINVASVAALGPAWLSSTYPASKAWVLNFTESLARSHQVRAGGVRMMALLPGYTRTAFHRSAGMATGRIPPWLWLDPDFVVRKALRDLALGRRVSTPGLRYRLLAAAVRHLPRWAVTPFCPDLSHGLPRI